MSISTLSERSSLLIDQETAAALGPQVVEQLQRLLEGCGEALRVCLAPRPELDGKVEQQSLSSYSCKRAALYGSSANDGEEDQYRMPDSHEQVPVGQKHMWQ